MKQLGVTILTHVIATLLSVLIIVMLIRYELSQANKTDTI
jgi:hypothetical protein